MLAASVPELSAALLDDIGRGDLAIHLARLTSQRIFLEPVLGRPDHVRTHRGRRRLPPPSAAAATGDARSTRRSRPCSTPAISEHALVLSARVGDPQRAREVLLAIDHPDWLSAPDALDAALDVAERGGPHHQLTELRGDLAYQRGQWDDALRLYAEARQQHGQPTAARARKRAGPAVPARAARRGRRGVCRRSPSTGAIPPRRPGCSALALGDLLGAR